MTPQMIGKKRLVALGGLLALNILFLALSVLFFAPQIEKNTRNMNRVDRDISRYQNDLKQLKSDLSNLSGQKTLFDELKARYFFSVINPSKVQNLFRRLAEEAGVEATIDIPQVTTVYVPELEKIGAELFERSVKIDIRAIDDADIYYYVSNLSKELPGYIKLKDLDISRKMKFNEDILKAIIRGEFPVVIEATLAFDWYYMILPAAEPAASAEGG